MRYTKCMHRPLDRVLLRGYYPGPGAVVTAPSKADGMDSRPLRGETDEASSRENCDANDYDRS